MALGESFQFEIGANVRDAHESLGALKRRLQELKGDVDAVDDTEVSIDADAREVDDVADTLDRVRREAEQGIDIHVDTNGSAARAADDVKRLGVNADGLQSGIGPLRGFTDELGGTAAAGGTAANALIDAGEAAQIFGSQLGFSEAALGKISLALGGVGLAAGGLIALYSHMKQQQEELEEQLRDTTNEFLDQLGVLDGIRDRFANPSTGFDTFADQLLGDDAQRAAVLADLLKLDLTLTDLPDVIRAISQADDGFVKDLLTGNGVGDATADAIAKMVAEGESFSRIMVELQKQPGFRQISDEAKDTIKVMVDLVDEVEGLHIEDAVVQSLGQILAEGGAAADIMRRLREEFPDESYVQLFDRLATEIANIRDNAGDVPPPFSQEDLDTVLGVSDALATAASNTEATATATERLIGTYDLLSERLSQEQQLLGLAASWDQVLEKAGDYWAAQQDETESNEKAYQDYRRELIRFSQEIIRYAENVEGIPPEKVTKLIQALDSGNLADIQRQLEELTADQEIKIRLAVDNPGEIKFVIDKETGAPTLVSGGAQPTVVRTVNTPTPAAPFSGDDLSRVLSGRGGPVTNNYYTIGQDATTTAQQRRDYEFGNGPQ